MTSPSATQQPATPKEEALPLLRDTVARLSGPDADIASALRTALHVSNLMGWSEAADWFLKEINGHEGSASVPPHRSVTAYEDWRPYTMRGIIEQVVKESNGLAGGSKKTVPWLLTVGIDTLVQYAQHGVIVQTGQDEDRWSDISKKTVNGRFVTVVDAQQANYCVQRLRNIVFGWASRNYSVLLAGDVASDIWVTRRTAVDRFLSTVDLSRHLDAIQQGLLCPEPQRWREAMWSSRDLLHDIAVYLWQDDRKTYRHLKDDDGKAIQVTEDRYINRLIAYLHQKGVIGASGAYLRSEWARLRSLNSLASAAHDREAVTLEDARLVFFSVYGLLGELVERTDAQPVEKYQ